MENTAEVISLFRQRWNTCSGTENKTLILYSTVLHAAALIFLLCIKAILSCTRPTEPKGVFLKMLQWPWHYHWTTNLSFHSLKNSKTDVVKFITNVLIHRWPLELGRMEWGERTCKLILTSSKETTESTCRLGNRIVMLHSLPALACIVVELCSISVQIS